MNRYCKSIKSLEEIPDVAYDGYIWVSDENKPRRLSNKTELLTIKDNPFIVEGHLKSLDETISISIKDAGGVKLLHQFDLNAIAALPADQKTETNLLVHRLPGVAKIRMTTVWLPEKDEACESMDVMRPAMRVFNGFELNK